MLWIISIKSLTNYGVSAGLLINQQWEEILQSRQYWLKRLISTLIEESEISPGAEETMRELKARGIRVGIGSDMTAWVQFRKLEKLGLLQYCDFVVTSEESNADKPDAEFYSLCLKKAQCEPGECIYKA